MRRLFPVLVAALLLPAAALSGDFGSRAISGWFNVTTPEGWQGRRYMDGNSIFAEEFDSNGDGRIDVWRFYRRGMLSSEERDLDGDGRVDLQTHWDARNVRLLSVFRDTNRRGVNDLEIEAVSARRWEIREDRNLDGTADRVLFVNGPPDLFDLLDMDLAVQTNVIDAIPREYWHELWTDEGYSGSITEYYRFTRGGVSQRGQWDGRRIAWSRSTGEYAAATPPPPARPPQVTTAVPPPVATGDIRDPFDFSQGGLDPYDGMPQGQTPPYSELDPIPYPDMQQPMQPVARQPYFPPQGPAVRDRTRYEGLPPGDSAARSVPARMRPPGTSRR